MVVVVAEILASVHQITVSPVDPAVEDLEVEQVMAVQAVPLLRLVKETQEELLLETFMEQVAVVVQVPQELVVQVPQVVTRVVLVRPHL
jgi:hypothetical protein